MAKGKEMEHFLRFSMIAVFSIACLAILGLTTLVLDGSGTLTLPSRENLAGGAVTGIQSYLIGELSQDGRVYELKLSGETLNIISPTGELVQTRLYATGEAYTGTWTHADQATPVSVVNRVASFHFPEGKVNIPLRIVYKR